MIIEIAINLLALAAGVSLGIAWERLKWVSARCKLMEHISQSTKSKD